MATTASSTSSNRIYSNVVTGYTRLTSNPGLRKDPISGKEAIHAGVDIAIPVGTSIKTPADGQVFVTGSSPAGISYGNYIIIAHPNAQNPTSFTLYGHLKAKPEFEVGTAVSQGQEIGLSGNTGKSTGPHLHYEERKVGQNQTINFDIKSDASNVAQFYKTRFLDTSKNELGFGTWNPSKIAREDLTKNERLAQIKLTEGEFESYKTTLASVETKGLGREASYGAVSPSGSYHGRYQLGDLALQEAGFRDKSGNWTALAKENGVDSFESFRGNPAAQDKALRLLTDKNAEFLVRQDLDTYIGDAIDGKPLTAAGLLLGAHNNRSHLDDYIKSEGEWNQGDGNGFAIGNYVALGDKVQSATLATSTKAPIGHWEDTTQYDELANVIEYLLPTGQMAFLTAQYATTALSMRVSSQFPYEKLQQASNDGAWRLAA